MPSKVAVVIPNHKEELNELEKISLVQCMKVLGHYPIIFAIPEGKDFAWIPQGRQVIHMPHLGQGIKHYNILLMSPQFYEPFFEYDYILIYHVDAFVFYDALEEFCRLGYDYIGAPWPYYTWKGSHKFKMPRVGNGGFSLRKVASCYKLLMRCSALPNWTTFIEDSFEDSFFGVFGIIDAKNFKVAPIEVAKLFSMEHRAALCVKRLGNELPFGCHGWTKLSADFYVELFAEFGYDLRPFRNMMSNDDYEIQLSIALPKLALERLTRRVERGQPLLKYLPAKRFASVRVIRSPEAMKILSLLIVEDNSISDKLFIYDEKDFRNLIRDVTCEDLPHLLLCTDYDKSLIEAIERKGLTYGEHVISFLQEYFKFQENLFHSLGR